MFQLRRTEEEEYSDEISKLRLVASQNNDRLLDKMLCQEIYKKVINCKGGWGIAGTPLHAAVSKGHLSCLKVLLAHGAFVDTIDVKAQTPLFNAVRGRHLDCVLVLLAAGANPNGSKSNNSSPVITAAKNGDVEILRQLLAHGANANTCSKFRLWPFYESVTRGPLCLSAVNRHIECFRLLLLHGADPNYNCTDVTIHSIHHRTMLEMCLRYGCGVEYIQMLIDFGANVYLPKLIIERFMNQPAVELLLSERGTPKALTWHCRLAVRRHLNSINKSHCINELDMPTSLKNFLQYKTVPVHVQ
ncbi:ankyrin repeat and SOCS box protein 12-like [Poecilia reticulata]|uniref:Ankyrin repeat and SOCS box-containing 12a n=1 Tax=Poecilia reticulata TaxID=8081 RepID=A0A3P9MUE4_POERE|nr:PREDICTED: ankyrin repeat and SOCS box protein 12-like [Poecilia reticulata]